MDCRFPSDPRGSAAYRAKEVVEVGEPFDYLAFLIGIKSNQDYNDITSGFNPVNIAIENYFTGTAVWLNSPRQNDVKLMYSSDANRLARNSFMSNVDCTPESIDQWETMLSKCIENFQKARRLMQENGISEVKVEGSMAVAAIEGRITNFSIALEAKTRQVSAQVSAQKLKAIRNKSMHKSK